MELKTNFIVLNSLQSFLGYTKNIFIFLVLYSPVNLIKHNIYTLFARVKQYLACFDFSKVLRAFLLSCGIARPVIQTETGVTASVQVIRSGQ